MEIANDLEAVRALVREILAQLAEFGYDENAHFALRLAMDEALSNAYDHGNRGRPERRIFVSYELCRERVKVSVRDEGEGFDHRRLEDPRGEAALNRTRGRGIFLIRQFMSEVRFNQAGNQITLIYRRDRQGASGGPGLKIWEHGGATVLDVPPELPADCVHLIGLCLEDLLDTGHRRLALDLSGRERVEEELRARLAELGGRLEREGARLAVVHPAACGPARFATLEEALRSLGECD